MDNVSIDRVDRFTETTLEHEIVGLRKEVANLCEEIIRLANLTVIMHNTFTSRFAQSGDR